ncbi:MAG: TOBE domain-containing protein [Rhodobacteraceae bacterium]|nr:TOBE domain-containing protein [Paracoccaceae bacterium]
MRPEQLHQDSPGETRIQLSVGVIEQLGADTVVHGTLVNSQTPLAVRLNGVQVRDSGDSIALSCAAQQARD